MAPFGRSSMSRGQMLRGLGCVWPLPRHPVLVARELATAPTGPRMDLARRNADLGSHAELGAVRELRRRVVHHDRAVELVNR